MSLGHSRGAQVLSAKSDGGTVIFVEVISWFAGTFAACCQ